LRAMSSTAADAKSARTVGDERVARLEAMAKARLKRASYSAARDATRSGRSRAVTRRITPR
jgi:hypothetical protein